MEREKKEQAEGYIESLRVKEAERRRAEASTFDPGETSKTRVTQTRDSDYAVCS